MTQNNQALAVQAMETFDEMGEKAMAHFVYHARRFESQANLWKNGNSEMLTDQSFITLSSSHDHSPHYLFSWLDADNQPHITTRPASGEKPPQAPEPSHHLMQWPTTEDIQKYALEKAMAEAAQIILPDTDPEDFDDCEIDTKVLAIMDLLAPELRKAVNHEIINESCPQNAVDTVESYLDDYANDAIARVPTEQWQALVNHIAKAMSPA